MKQKKLKLYFTSLMVLLAASLFMGGDCSTDNNEEISPPDSVAPPGLMTFKVEADAGGDSRVTFNWTSSSDENDANFKGYRIITFEIDSNDHQTVYQEQALGKTVETHSINPLARGVRYKTFILAERNNGTKSDSLETEVYAAIFYNNNGVIHSYNASGNSQSGFGWNKTTGNGTQYTYNQSNSENIDLHLREESTGLLFFKSPDFLDEFSGTDYRFTQMNFIGYGQEAFNETNLSEPGRTEVLISDEGVYLLKTEDENYVKVWVKGITQTGNPPYFNIEFEYKFQPIKNLRIL